jgi:hypothetical protein
MAHAVGGVQRRWRTINLVRPEVITIYILPSVQSRSSNRKPRRIPVSSRRCGSKAAGAQPHLRPDPRRPSGPADCCGHHRPTPPPEPAAPRPSECADRRCQPAPTTASNASPTPAATATSARAITRHVSRHRARGGNRDLRKRRDTLHLPGAFLVDLTLGLRKFRISYRQGTSSHQARVAPEDQLTTATAGLGG